MRAPGWVPPPAAAAAAAERSALEAAASPPPPAKLSLLMDKQALKVGGVHLPTGKITAPERVAEFFCRSTLLYVAPPPEGHEDLYVQLLTHVLKTTKVTFGVVVVALRYFDMYTRLAADYAGVASPEAGGGPTSPPKLAGQVRFVIASLMTAAKFLDDVTYGNRSWSVVSGIPQDELTEAEIAILGILAYNLHMQVADFQQWMGRLQTITAHLEATRFARLGHGKAAPADPATAHAHAAAADMAATEHRARLLTITRMPLVRPRAFPIFDRPETPQLPIVEIVEAPPEDDTFAPRKSLHHQRGHAHGLGGSSDETSSSSPASAAAAAAAAAATGHRSPRKGGPIEERRASAPLQGSGATAVNTGQLMPEDRRSSAPILSGPSAQQQQQQQQQQHSTGATSTASSIPLGRAPSAASASASARPGALQRARAGSAAASESSVYSVPDSADTSTAPASSSSNSSSSSGPSPVRGRSGRREGSSDAATSGFDETGIPPPPAFSGARRRSFSPSSSSSLLVGLQAGFTMVMRSIRAAILPDSPEPDSGIETGDDGGSHPIGDAGRDVAASSVLHPRPPQAGAAIVVAPTK